MLFSLTGKTAANQDGSQFNTDHRELESRQDVQAITCVLNNLSKASTREECLRLALNTIREQFGWVYGSYWEMDLESNRLHFHLQSGNVNAEFQRVTESASFAEGEGLSGRAWHQRDLVFVKDLGELTDCCRRQPAQRAGVKSGVCFPIIVNGNVCGTMDFFTTDTIELSSSRQEALRNVSNLVSATFERLQHQENQAELLQDSSAVTQLVQLLAGCQTREAVAEKTLETILKAFGWAYGSYWPLDRNTNTVRYGCGVGQVSSEFDKVTREASFAEGVGLSGRAWKKRDIVTVEDLGELTDCCRREPAQRAGVKSGICLPILLEGEVQGTLDFFTTQRLYPSQERLHALRSVAHLVASAFGRIVMDEKRRELSQCSQATHQVLVALQYADSPEAAVQVALNNIRQLFGWAYGSYWKLDPTANVLRFSLQSGSVNPEFQQVTESASFAEGVGLSGRAWKKRDLVFVEDLGELTDCCRRSSAQRAGVKSGICLPIMLDGQIQGTMDFFTTERLTPSEERMSTLRAIGQVIGNTLESLNRTLQAEKTTQQIQHEVEAVTTLSNEVSQSLQTLSLSTQEMTASIHEISKNAQQAAQATALTEQTTQETRHQIENLANAARQVSNVIELIKSVASQTNLLALNATIEAATAGDAGKGFAVVASEVKELAKQTAQSTEEVRHKIEEMQHYTNNVLEAMGTITQKVSELNQVNTVIAAAVEEQTVTTASMSDSLTTVSSGSQTIANKIQTLASTAAH